MGVKCDHIADDLQTQWQDHFHMRDQTWKLLQYSILFFLGVIGLEYQIDDRVILSAVYLAVNITSLFGLFVAVHHRRRQREKFEMITIYAEELGLYELIAPVILKSKKGFFGKMSTSLFIIVMQTGLFIVSLFLLTKKLFPDWLTSI